jgi:hypothetical protein
VRIPILCFNKKGVQKIRAMICCQTVHTTHCVDPEEFIPDPTAQFITDSNRILELGQ